MRNFTLSQSKLFRLNFLVLFLFLINYNASAQFFKKHYIAPAPWQYLSRANEIVIATNSTVAVKFTITTSKGDLVPLTKNGVTVDNTQLSTIKGAPAVYRFVGDPNTDALGYNLLGKVYDNRGLIVTTVDTGTGKDLVSVNLRNVASDAIGGGGDDKIKGNASLTSFGDAGIGVEFRVGYYRNVTSATATDRPIYSVMAINDGTQVKLKGVLLTTLKAGESYLFNADIGDLVESSGGPVVMNTGMRIDVPGGCGDGTFDQLPPVSVLGTEYFIERGKGNDTTEQTTVVATKPGTVLTINTFDATTGAEISGSPITINLPNAGSFHTFKNGVSGNQFTSSRILANNNVAVYSGTGQTCEVDISTIAPVSACGGSVFVETSSFLGYTSNSLDYFGYVLLKSSTDVVTLNSATPINLGPRRKLGTTDWYIIDFNRDQIGNPNVISISSNSKLTVSIAQQGSGYSMAAFFSNFAQQPTPPKETYINGTNCLKQSATLTTDAGFSPYEWRYNGTVMPGQTSNTITVTKTGSYTVISTLSCGISSQSTPIAVTLCSDVAVENKVDAPSQCVGSNVVFTVTAKNSGPSNAEGVSVTDKLPSGYDYVSSIASTGTSYNSSTGIWTISGLDNGASAVLTITAKVKASGSYSTSATITSSNVDDPTGNNSASATVSANALPTTPTVVVTAESCSVAASNILSVYDSNLTYTSTPTGLLVGAGGVITGGITGTSYAITATNNTSCSATSASFTYNGKAKLAVPATPTVVVTAESCSAAASNILSVYDSNLTYTSTPTGLLVGAGGVITGGITGTSYAITATNNTSCSATSASFTYNGKAKLAVPATPTVVVTAENCSAAASNILSVYDSNLTYTSTPTGLLVGAGGVITGGITGTSYAITATNNTSCSATSASFTYNGKAKLAVPATPTVVVTAESCSAAASNILSVYDSNLTYTSTPTGLLVGAGGVITGGITGTSYAITATNNTSCSATSASFTYNGKAKLAVPATPTVVVTAESCSAAASNILSVYDSNLTYTSTPTGLLVGAGGVITGGITGTSYAITATNNTSCSATSASFTYNGKAKLAFPATPTVVVTAESCSAAASNILSVYDSNLTYTSTPTGLLVGAGGVITGGITGTSYAITATNNTSCSATSASFTYNGKAKLAVPATPTVVVTAESCSAAASNILSVYDSNLTYTSTPTGLLVGAGGVITGGITGTSYAITATNNTSCFATSASFTYNGKAKLAVPATPTVVVTAENCSAAASNILSVYDSNLTYTSTPTGLLVGAGGVITGGITGTSYAITATNNTSCFATSASFTYNGKAKLAVPATPTVVVTAESCSAAASNILSVYDSNLTYTSTPTGLLVGAGGVITGGITGTSYAITATNNTSCFATSASFTYNGKAKLAVPATPTVVVTAESCSAAASNILSVYDSNLTYTSTPTGLLVGAGGVITGGITGTSYAITATNNTSCFATSASFTYNGKAKLAVPATPTVVVTAENCSAAASNILSVYDSNLTYTSTPTGLLVGAGGVITGGITGTSYAITATNNTSCFATSASFTYNGKAKLAVPATPTVVVTAESCSAAASNILSVYDSNLTYTSTPTGLLVGAGGVITGGITGTSYAITATNNTSCFATSASFTYNGKAKLAVPATPTVVVTAESCSAAASNILSVYDSNLTYTSTPTGLLVGAGGVITGGITGTSYAITATNNTSCFATSASFTYNGKAKLAVPATPTVVVTAESCSAAASNILSVYDSNLTYTSTPTGLLVGAGGVITGGITGTSYAITATNNTSCFATSASFTYNGKAKLAVPATPTVVVTAESCSAAASNILSVYDSNLTYTSTPTGLLVGAGGVITGGITGTSYAITATNNTSCFATSASFTYNGKAKLAVPTAPTVGTITQPTCALVTGSVVLNGLPAGNWIINPGNISGSTASTTISGLGAGTTFNYTVTNSVGCESVASENIVIWKVICAIADTPVAINGKDGGTTGSVLDNDTLNGNLVNPSDVVVAEKGTYPIGITLNSNGTITVDANTPAGSYELEYTICEKLNLLNCASGIVTVVVGKPVILAVKENLGPINGSTGGTTTSLIASDKLNGVQAVIGTNPGEVTLTGTAPTGLTVNADGTVTVNAGVKAGSYDVEYTICDNNNPGTNCSTATSTVVVTAADLVANLDSAGSVVGGNTSQTLINVFDNDTKNGTKLNPSDVKLTPGTDPKGYLTIDANGNAVLGANAPAGNYELTYEICEVLNPTNCSSNKIEVTVTAPAILAVKENLGPINGTIGGTTTSLIASDKLNNLQAVIGTNPGEVTLTGTALTGLTVNADGTVTVSAGVKAGSYDVTYTICDNNNPGTNCSTATSTVVVTAADLVANLDSAGSVVGGNISQTLINVFDNDTKNGTKLNPSDVKLTPGTDPKGYLTIDANGNAVLGTNAPAGNYELTYEICEVLNPGNCSSNKIEVTVTAPAILAVKENLGPINGTIGGTTTSLIASDKLNGVQAVIGTNPGEVTLTGTAPTGLTVNADGTVTVNAGVKAGSYDVEYTICDNNNPGTNCSTATSTVVVTAADLVANLDSAGSVVGGNTSQTLINVFDNDTKNGTKLNPSDVKLTPGTDPKGYLTIDANGNAVLGANAPAGNYELTYEICEVLNPTNCSSNKIEVTVTAPAILAVKENLGPINGTIGGTTTSLIASDKLNNLQAVIGTNPGEVTLTGTALTGLTVNADGTVTVSAGVKAGSYDVTYTICDNNNPGTNCSTATSTVVVTAADLVANLDSAGSVVGGNISQTLINVFDNDTKNGTKLNPSDVKLTPGTDPKGYLTIDANGNAVLGTNAPAGNYELTYEICEVLNPGNCSSNKIEVTVTAPAILAVKENLGPINGTIGGTTTSLIASDKLNGVQAVIGTNPGEVTLTGTAPTGLTVNADGTVTVNAGVKAGSYDVEYTICDNNNPGTNCSTATSTVVVTAADLVANLDSAGSVVGGNTSQTLINVFDNDTKNGTKLNPSDVKLTPGTDPKGYLTIDANGNAVLGANAPAGNYELTYEICEVLNPTNCSSNKIEVTVTAPAILAVKENLGPINGTIGGTTTSLIASDKLNNLQAVIGTNPGEVTLTGTALTGLTVNADGTVTVSAGVKAGSYDVTYTICDNNNPGTNCSTATSTVVVTAADLVANLDSAGSVVGGNISQTLINVFDNDTKNGTKLNPSDVKLTPGTDPKGYLTIDANGNAVLGTNAPAGNYELTYEICEVLNPTNCSSNKIEVTVTAPAILAVKENLGPINGSTGGTTTSLIASDKLNNLQAVIGTNPGEVTLTGTALTGLTVNADGTVTVSAGVKAGSYDVTYTICDNNNPGTNCSTATSTVVITAADLVANLDSAGSVVGGNTSQTLINVFDNDTKNGTKLNPSDVKLTPGTDPKGYLTIDANGNAVLGTNAPAGNYELTYEICEVLNPTNCSSNKIEVTVTAPAILAVKENLGPINGSTGGTTTSLIASDKLNNLQAVIGTNPGEVTLTGTAPTGLTVNADGTVTVSAGVKAGSYDVTYTICDNNNPGTNCSTATSTVVITAADLVANLDSAGSVVGGNTSQTLINVFDNDTKNGTKLNPSDVKLTPGTDPKGYLTIDANGNAVLGANAPAGNYELTYEICELLNPTNCSSNKIEVTVNAPVILAVKENLGPINGSTGGTTTSLIASDKLNGVQAVIGTNPGEVTLTGTAPTGLTVNADGTVTVSAGVKAGSYDVEYTICDNNNPGTNCSTATSTVVVTVADLVANLDSAGSVVGGNTSQTLINVFDNDTKNGTKLNPSDVKLTPGTDPKGYLTIDANGNAVLGANAPAGNYELTYEICELLNPTNCSSNKIEVTVNAPVILAVKENLGPINGSTGGTTTSLIASDKLNGVQAVIGTNPGEVSLTGTAPTGLTVNADGTVTVSAGVKAGSYDVEYTICDNNNPGTNCSTATSTVVVTAADLVANLDSAGSVVGGNASQTLINVFENDTKNGIKLNPSDVKLTPGPDPKGYLTIDANGNAVLGANAPAGNYELTYEICEVLNPTNCSSNKIEVTVKPAALQANNDNAGTVDSSKGQSSTTSIFDNDTLNGSKVNPADLVLTIVVANPNLILKTDGTIEVKPGTATGTYELTYQICEALNPTTNCSQAIAKISVVNNPPITPLIQIIANNDGVVNVDGINGALEFINVLDNDLIKGLPVNPLEIILSNTPNPYFEFNSDGTVSVKPNTPGGSYSLTYQACEKSNPTNCASAILSVFVEVPSIAIIKTAVFNDENGSGFANAGETITYKFKVTNTGNVPLTGVMISDPLPGVVVSGQAINLNANESDEHNFTATYKITQNDINKGSVSNQASVQARSAKGVVVDDLSDDENETGDKPTVLGLNGCVIKVFNAFSPNGDDINSRFYIRGLECYPDNTVEIYNRWGVLVYDISNYNNDDRAFKGFSEGRTTVKQSEGLPVGTYFYILKYKDSGSNPHELSGYLYINK